ncbi:MULTISPECIES: DNA polymerase III subunit gamma/tau [Alteromonas]|jgi:DNA polymerase-3 subunit gamma/tau|uniref:DNA polymerase III subunit gamma/tau n=1 Tax=Alteromonas TaxID=226 RepID=UPI001287CC38|nr:DNA polymerase III subunit gamma/tau [Alteromonas macleodii]MDM7964317.1 DNA polymerase III subunit gamma/tau [Alteromonas macleodii]CAI3963051.1 DNA polymerase-3 subunit gamma/tau [Alteromonas macleodii]VTP56363.1 DNA polymerase-3 subunit gamma/tau [Alteromonas macleodii]
MSYQVLARKWRPGKFSELVGQEHVVSAISNALDNDRLHHAYLFTGTRGVGKTTIARIFSKSLNCEEGQGANPCGQCNTCKEIEQGNYVDLLEIDAASRTKVEDTRELLDNVQYKPTRGRYKVYLIDEVHMLSKHSFNALLKTLEEPPPHVKFLLATTDPQKLPITILSRCLQFNLKAMSREQIVGQLQHILEHEQLPFEPQALALLARAAQGSMRDALSLTDQAIAQGGNQVLASVVTDMLGLMDKNQLLKVVHAVVSKSPADVLQLVNDIAEQAPDYDNVHSELASLLHQIALTQWVPEACKLETTSAKAIFQLAKTIPAEQVQLLYQIALQGRKDLPFAADGKSAFEMTLMRMMSFAPNTPIDDTVSEIENGRSEHSLPVDHASSSGGPGNVGKQEEAPLSETSATNVQEETPSHLSVESTSEQSLGSAPSTQDSLATSIIEKEQQEQSTSPFESQQEQENAAADESDTLSALPHAESGATSTQTTALERDASHDDESVKPAPTSSIEELAVENTAVQAVQTESVAAELEPTPSKVSASHNEAAQYFDEPPLDAYMDDMPLSSEDDGSLGFDGFQSAEGFHNAKGSDKNSESLAHENEASSLTAEEQLTSTADMLALRQKLKQRKAQDAEAKSTSAANAKTESASDIQARFTRSKAEALSAAQTAHGINKGGDNSSGQPSADNEIKSGDLNPVGHENSRERQDHSPEPLNSSPELLNSSPERIDSGSEHKDNSVARGDTPQLESTNSGSSLGNTHAYSSDAMHTSESEKNHSSSNHTSDFSLDEFEEDMPFSNDESEAQSNSETPVEDMPPWATDYDNQPPQHVEGADYVEAPSDSSSNYDSAPEQMESAGDRSFARDALNFDTPLSSTYDGQLKAYLNDGSKLTHASQIDEWSNLVEQMPVAGLLKQLVLHASFSRAGNQVSLEIDHSQTHLLNDSAKKQLVDAIHHGLGENVEVNITLGEPASTPFALQQEIHAMRHAHAHSVIKTDDTIQALLSTFDASVLTDSVKAR